jgi:hypothetical protein
MLLDGIFAPADLLLHNDQLLLPTERTLSSLPALIDFLIPEGCPKRAERAEARLVLVPR